MCLILSLAVQLIVNMFLIFTSNRCWANRSLCDDDDDDDDDDGGGGGGGGDDNDDDDKMRNVARNERRSTRQTHGSEAAIHMVVQKYDA